MTKIFLAASMNFYEELVRIEGELIARGFSVEIPVSAKLMKAQNDYVVEHFKSKTTPAQKGVLIKQNFDNISLSDALLVINNEKNGIQGYIGPNVLMEIGLAFHLNKKIFIWNQYPLDASYKDEMLALGVEVIDKNLEAIHV
jgi:hypothetical protein